MKVTTTVKYECSDGRVFSEPQAAREHEVSVLIDNLRGEDVKRLTAAEIMRLMADHPEDFIATLGEFCEDIGEENVAEFKSVRHAGFLTINEPHDASFDKEADDEVYHDESA